jgi:mono/diheme cytochrome c family protein
VGDIAAGQSKYVSLCARCHTADVRRNALNVTGASTVNGLNAALRGVGSMRFLEAQMSAQDRLDVSAYISSAR